MRRSWGSSGNGGDVDESREMVVGNGVTEDYSVVEDRRVTVIVRGVMRHAVLKTDRVLITGRFHGTVEASNLEVARGALFLGKAMVRTATIGGRLEGILVATGMLTMKAPGHCDGVLRYGNLHVQYGGQLTGAVKAASAADASIAEIPVPDLPEGTWDDYHWSSRKKIRKRMMMTVMGGGEPTSRGSDGGLKRRAGKRVKGGPRILRSAGKSVIPGGDLARRVAENTARREVTSASAARSRPAATVERGGLQSVRPDRDLARRVTENTAPRAEVTPASAARSRPAATVEGGPVVRPGKLGTGAREKAEERVTATSKGSATVMLSESGLPLLPSPSAMQQQPAGEKTRKVLVKPMRREGKAGAEVGDKRKDAPREPREKQARRSSVPRTRNTAGTVSRAAAEKTKAEVEDVDARGVKNGGSMAKDAWRGSRDSPTLKGRPSGASKPKEGGRDQSRPSGQAGGGMSSTKPEVRADRPSLISQEGVVRLRKVSRRRRGSGRGPARMTSIPRVPSSVAEPGAGRTVTSSEGTSNPDQTLALSSVIPPSISASDRAREAVAGEPTLRTQSATGSAAAGMAMNQQTIPVATPVAMSRNAGDDLRLPAALRAAFAAVGGVGDGDEAGQSAPMPESGGIRDGEGGGRGEGEGLAKTTVTTAEAGLHDNKVSHEDRSRQVEEAKAVLRSKFALGNSRGTKGVSLHPAERGPRRNHSKSAAALAANVDGYGQVGTGASYNSSPDGDYPFGVGTAQIERGGVSPDGGDGDGDGIGPRGPSEAAVGDGDSKNDSKGKARRGAGHETVEGDEIITEKEASAESGARRSAVSTPVSLSPAAAAAAAAAAALQAGDMSLFGGGPAVAGNDAAELPLPSTRRLRLSGSYTEAAVAAVAAAAALKRTESAFRTPLHGKSKVSGDSSKHTPVHDKQMFASPPQELILRDFGGGISARPDRSPPPGPAANAHRRQTAREQEMIRGLRVLPATATTSLQTFDRSKLPFSPTTRSRPKPSFQGSERAGWVSVPVQALPVAAAAEAAAKSAAAAATFAKKAAKVAERSTRNRGSDFDWSKVGIFPLVETGSTMNEATGAKSSSPVSPLIVARSTNPNSVAMSSSSYPSADVAETGHLHAPAATSASTTGPPLGGGGDTIQTAPVSPMVAMPMVVGSAREIGRNNPAEDPETDRVWMVGLTALCKEDSCYASSLGAAASPPPGGAGVSPAPSSAAPAVAVAPGVANIPSKSYTEEISPNSATAVALGVAVSSAMTSRKRVGGGERGRTRGRTAGGDQGEAQGETSLSVRSCSAGTAKTSSKGLMQLGGVEDSGAEESGGDASDRRRWREMRDRARESSGIGPASMARARHAARVPLSISPAFERSALPILSQLRRQNPPVSPGSISEMSRSPLPCTRSPSLSPRPYPPSRVSAPAESLAATTAAATAPFPERSNGDLGFAVAAAIATAKKARTEREEPEEWKTRTAQEVTVAAALAEERALAAEAVATRKASAAREALAAAKVASTKAEAAAEERAEKKETRGSEEPETRPEPARPEVPQEGSDDVSVAREGVDAGMDTDGDSAAEVDVDEGTWGDRLGGSMEESCMVSATISAAAAAPTHVGTHYSEEVSHNTGDVRVPEVVAPEPTVQEPTWREPTAQEPIVGEPTVQEPTVPEPALQDPGTDRYHSEIAIPTSPRPFVGDVPVEGELEYGPPFPSVVNDTDVGAAAGEATSSGEAPASGDLAGSSDDDAASEAEAAVETEIAEAAVSARGAEADATAAEAAAAAEAQVDATTAEAAEAEADTIAAKAAKAIGEKAVAEAEVAAAEAEADAIAAEATAAAAAVEAAAATEAAAAAEAATAVEAAAATKAAVAAQAAAAAGQAAKVEAEGAAAAATEAAEAASEAEAAAGAAATDSAVEPVHVDSMAAVGAAMPTPTGDTRGAAESFVGSAAVVTGDVVARGPACFPQTYGPRRSSIGAPSVLGGGRSRNRSGVSMAGKKIEESQAKDFPRIRSEGGMVGRKSGALIAGRPTKKQSGFVAPEAVRQGLGPAGAFTGNANWRVDVVREKRSSFANIKADGHGGFQNPMAALRAQQQQQQQQRHPWSGRVAPGSEIFAPPGTFTALDASGTATAAPSPEADAPSEKTPADADERLPPMPAWMKNKGLRNTPGVLLGRPRAARGRLHGGGSNVGVGVGFLPRPSTTSLPVASERQDEAPKVLPDSVDDGGGGDGDDGSGGQRGSSSNGAASTRGVESESDAEKRTEEGITATASGEDTDGSDDDPARLSRKYSTLNAPAAAAAAAGTDPVDHLEVTPQAVLGKSCFGSGRGSAGAKVMPLPETPPAEVVGAEDADDDVREQFAGGEDSKSGSSEGEGEDWSGTSALKLEAPTVAMELDSGAESGPYGDVEPLEIPSSPGASGGFAALGRFLFGNRPSSQREKIAPGEELDLGGKPRHGDFPSPASDIVHRDEVGDLPSARSIADGGDQSGVVESVGGGGVSSSSGRRDSFSTARSTTSTISGERVGSSSSDCTTAPTSSADGDGDGDGEDPEHGPGSAGASAEDALPHAVTPTLAPASTLVAAPPGVTESARARSRVRARARTYPNEGSTSPFDNGTPRPPSAMVELSPAVSSSASGEDVGQVIEVEASGRASTSEALTLQSFSPPSPSETPSGQEGLDVAITPASLTPAEDPIVSRRFSAAAAGDGKAADGEMATAEELDASRAEEGGEEDGVTPSTAMVASATMSKSSSAVRNASLLHAPGRTWSRLGSKAPVVASSVSNGSSGSGGGEGGGYRPTAVRAASLLSGERKTGLAALEHQGTGSKTARRALLTESKQRKSSDVKQKPSIFEILRQRSAGIASFQADKRESDAAAGRRRLLRAPSPRRPPASPNLTTAPALPPPKTSFASSPRSVPPVRNSTVGDAFRRVTRRGSRESLRVVAGIGGRGTVFNPLDEVEDDQVEPAGSDDDDEDEEPDYWSKYGVIDPAALEEDAEIEI